MGPFGLVAVIAYLFFDKVVYDDGDALVVWRRLKKFRIPINSIQRVSWNRNFQSIKLYLSPPSELGDTFSFRASHSFFPPEHNEIADDLHRRSRCCRAHEEENQETLGSR
jgi:hypothetical protein